MPEVLYADPTTTMEANTKKILSILPPIQETPETPIQRPIQNHATPRNLPPKQAQQFETAQPYRPNQPYDGLPSGASVGSVNGLRTTRTPRPALTTGQQYARDEAVAQAAYYSAYVLMGLWDGVMNSKSDNSKLLFDRDAMEDGAYELGYNAIGLTKQGITHAREIVKDITRNPPHFEIPQIKIPKLPHIPEIKIPDIKGFPDLKKIEIIEKQPEPKIPYREPETPPDNKSKEWYKIKEWIKEGESCVFAFNIAQSVFYKNGIVIRREAGVAPGLIIPEILDGIGASLRLADGIYFEPDVILLGGGGVDAGGRYGADIVKVRRAGFTIIPSTAKTNVSVLENFVANGTVPDYPAFTNLQLSPFSITSMEFGYCKTRPQNKPEKSPPEPPKKKMCCPDIDYRKIQAMIEDAINKIDFVTATPESWLIRPEHHRPQLIIQFGEKLANNKVGSAKYPLTIPHPKPTKPNKSAIPPYRKGNWEMIFVLKDNSKITVHAFNEIEATKVMNAAKQLVIGEYIAGGYLSKSSKVITKTPLDEIPVTPKMAKYFPDGRKSEKPEWIVKF